jgi:hypothetical protein
MGERRHLHYLNVKLGWFATVGYVKAVQAGMLRRRGGTDALKAEDGTVVDVTRASG